jgi:hypothetical protein
MIKNSERVFDWWKVSSSYLLIALEAGSMKRDKKVQPIICRIVMKINAPGHDSHVCGKILRFRGLQVLAYPEVCYGNCLLRKLNLHLVYY